MEFFLPLLALYSPQENPFTEIKSHSEAPGRFISLSYFQSNLQTKSRTDKLFMRFIVNITVLHENGRNKNHTFYKIQESFCQVKLMSKIPKKKMFCGSCLKKPLICCMIIHAQIIYTSPFYINVQIKKEK